jgi:hypothetical protein
MKSAHLQTSTSKEKKLPRLMLGQIYCCFFKGFTTLKINPVFVNTFDQIDWLVLKQHVRAIKSAASLEASPVTTDPKSICGQSYRTSYQGNSFP